MSDQYKHVLSSARLVPVLLVLGMLAGCGTIQGIWKRIIDPARAEPPMEQPAYDPWTPLSAPGNPYAVPSWPTGPYTGSGGGQADGMATLIRELDHLTRLVETVSRMPPDPGEFQINFLRIHADLSAVRAGLVEALLKPHAAPRDYPPIQRDYLE